MDIGSGCGRLSSDGERFPEKRITYVDTAYEIINDVIEASRECGGDFIFRIRNKTVHYYTVQFARKTQRGSRIVGAITIYYTQHSHKAYYEAFSYLKDLERAHRKTYRGIRF